MKLLFPLSSCFCSSSLVVLPYCTNHKMAGRSLSWLLAAILLVSLCFTPYTTASPVDIGKLEKRDDGNNQHVKRQSVTLARARGSALASMMSTVTPSSTLAPVRPTTSTLAPVRPTTTSRSASTSSSSSAATPSNTNYAFASNILRAHNSARASHGAAALTWSSGAESLAKTWAERCVW